MRISARVLAVLFVTFVFSASSQASTIASIDRFTLYKDQNGGDPFARTAMFDDHFDDASSVPNFRNGNPGSYNVAGSPVESGSRLTMSTENAVVGTSNFAPGLYYKHRSRLLTNTSNLDDRNCTIDCNNIWKKGLKTWHNFAVQGLFDLEVPAKNRENYGIRLTDGDNDAVNLRVRRSGSGNLQIQLRDLDFGTGTSTNLVNTALNVVSGFDQIMLQLFWDAETGLSAGYEYFLSGVGQGLNLFDLSGIDTTALLFSDENWTRAEFNAVAPVPEPTTRALMVIGQLGLLVVSRRRLS
jgi:hypothetical protein